MLISNKKPNDFSNNDLISCIYVIYNNKILLLQYGKKGPKNKDLIGKWGIVSGKNEEGEDRYECAIRELFEETGITIDIKDLQEYGHYFYMGNVNREVFDFLIVLNQEPEIKLSEEHKKYEWVKLEDILKYDLVRGRQEILKKKMIEI